MMQRASTFSLLGADHIFVDLFQHDIIKLFIPAEERTGEERRGEERKRCRKERWSCEGEREVG